MRTHRPPAVLAALLAALLAGAAGCSELLGPHGDREAAARAAERWALRHPSGAAWSLETTRALEPASWSPPCSAAPASGSVTLRYVAPGADLLLAFRCPVAEPAGPAELQAAFSHAVLDRLPHGISVTGWRFRLLTPTSSVSEGVTFSPGSGGRVEVRIQTPLYAITGQSSAAGCEPPADAPMPPECLVHRPHAVPLSISLTAPIRADALR